MNSLLALRVVVLDHDDSSGDGYHFRQAPPFEEWRSITQQILSDWQSESKRNLSESLLVQPIREGLLILVGESIKSAKGRSAVRISSGLLESKGTSIVPPFDLHTAAADLRSGNYSTQDGELPELSLHIADERPDWLEVESAGFITTHVGREMDGTSDIQTGGQPAEMICMAWAISSPEARRNTRLFIGSNEVSISTVAKRKWAHSIESENSSQRSTEDDILSVALRKWRNNPAQFIQSVDGMGGQGSEWWKNASLLLDDAGLPCPLSRNALMRLRLKHGMRKKAIDDLELGLRLKESGMISAFLKHAGTMTPVEIDPLHADVRSEIARNCLEYEIRQASSETQTQTGIHVLLSYSSFLSMNELIAFTDCIPFPEKLSPQDRDSLVLLGEHSIEALLPILEKGSLDSADQVESFLDLFIERTNRRSIPLLPKILTNVLRSFPILSDDSGVLKLHFIREFRRPDSNDQLDETVGKISSLLVTKYNEGSFSAEEASGRIRAFSEFERPLVLAAFWSGCKPERRRELSHLVAMWSRTPAHWVEAHLNRARPEHALKCTADPSPEHIRLMEHASLAWSTPKGIPALKRLAGITTIQRIRLLALMIREPGLGCMFRLHLPMLIIAASIITLSMPFLGWIPEYGTEVSIRGITTSIDIIVGTIASIVGLILGWFTYKRRKRILSTLRGVSFE